MSSARRLGRVQPRGSRTPNRSPRARARRAAPDWLPVIGWFVDDGQRHSRINVVPMGNTVDPTERFTTTLKFFRGAEQPVHTFLSEPFAGDRIFRYDSPTLLEAIGEASFEGLVEITARSLENPPSHFPWIDSWLEFSRRRRLAERLRARVRLQGRHHQTGHERQVAALAGRRRKRHYCTSVLLLNYHPRPTPVRFDLLAPSGRLLSSETLSSTRGCPAHLSSSRSWAARASC